MNKNKNKAIRIFFIISIALHTSILLCFTDIFSAKTPERRIEVDLIEMAEEDIRSSEFPMPKKVDVNYDPIKNILHQQVKYRQYPKTIVESIKETKYKPISVASISNFFPKHYDFNNTNKNKGKVSPLFYYQQLIKQKIEENKRYPLLARNKGIEGKVWVKFEILKDGKVKDIKVVKSSHHQILDKAAIESIKKANPFPPFPEELKESSLIINICLRFELKNYAR
ncbi:MAG: energy transducer TonB [Candidatus Desulfofervidus auxilii]|nr:energy transducer TonB [Candidatus Desulfofervidus auxilii]